MAAVKKVLRAPRIRSFSLGGTTLIVAGTEYQVLNLSFSGLSVRVSGNGPSGKFSGVLRIANENYALELETVRVTGDRWAGRIFSENPGFQAFILRYFEPEIAALRLIPVNRANLKSSGLGQPYWHFDGRASELYYSMRDDEFTLIRIVYAGNSIEWQEGKTRYASVDNSAGSQFRSPGTRTLQMVSRLPEPVMNVMERFVNHVEGLPEDRRSGIVRRVFG